MNRQDREYIRLVKRARALARKHGREFYVVRDIVCDEIGLDVCDYETLVTFYDGIREENVLYCTADDE